MTLLEVLINLVILALVSSVATLALRPGAHRGKDARRMLDDSLTAAIAQRRVITITLPLDGRLVSATAYPDGSIDADSTFHSAPIYVR
jgi:hypothetical protein